MTSIRFLLTAISVLFTAGVLTAATVPYWPAELFWQANMVQLLPLEYLLAPAVLLVSAAIMLRAWKTLWLNLLTLITLFFFVLDFNVPFGSAGAGEARGRIMRVITLNIGQGVKLEKLADFLEDAQPDLLVFQDTFADTHRYLRQVPILEKYAIDFADDLGLASAWPAYKVESRTRPVAGAGNVVSKYIVNHPAGSFMLLNVHVVSPRKGILALWHERLQGILAFKAKSLQMTKEIADIQVFAREQELPALIAGDFNFTLDNPVFRGAFAGRRDAFIEAGWGFGHTFNSGWHGLRIDHILLDDDWSVVRSFVGPDLGGQHRPLLADLVYHGSGVAAGQRPAAAEAAAPVPEGSAVLLKEDFQRSTGALTATPGSRAKVDPLQKHIFGNSLRLAIDSRHGESMLEWQPKIWRLDEYPLLRFAHRIPEGTPFEIQVQTPLGDWVTIAHTPAAASGSAVISPASEPLVDDGQWHTVTMDAAATLQAKLKAVKRVTALRLGITANRHQRDSLWLDDLLIFSPSGPP